MGTSISHVNRLSASLEQAPLRAKPSLLLHYRLSYIRAGNINGIGAFCRFAANNSYQDFAINVKPQIKINLLGPFSIVGPQGEVLTPKLQRARALIAMLALAPRQARSRVWLRDKLWSTRSEEQSSLSLRQLLHQIKHSLGPYSSDILSVSKTEISLVAENIDLGFFSAEQEGEYTSEANAQEQLLEGLDIRDEEFEEWLTVERQAWRQEFVSRTANKQNVHQGRAGSQSLDKQFVHNGLTAPNTASKPLFPGPSLAVLPFNSIDDSVVDPYVAEGLADDLIVEMSRNRWLRVVARHAGLSSTGSRDVVMKSFGVNYVLSGSLSVLAEFIEIKLVLEDCVTGAILWTDTVKSDVEKIHHARSSIAAKLSAHLITALGRQEQDAAFSARFDDLESWQQVHLGNWYMARPSSDNTEMAKTCYEKILAVDPNHAEALFSLAWWYVWKAWLLIGSPRITANLEQVTEYARRGLRMDPGDARGYAYVAAVEILNAEPVAAIRFADEALTRNPSMAFAHAIKGSGLLQINRNAEAIGYLEESLNLGSAENYRFHTLSELSAACFFESQFKQSLAAAEHALFLSPRYWYPKLLQLSVYGGKNPYRDLSLARKIKVELNASYRETMLKRIDSIPYSETSRNRLLRSHFESI